MKKRGKRIEKHVKFIGLLSLCVLFLVGLPIREEASEKMDDSLVSGFSWEVIYPENQLDQTKGYYDLLMEPGQKQVLSLKLLNSSLIESVVRIQLSTATTNSNGVIEYGPSSLEPDKSLIHDFSDLVKGPETVTIPPESSQLVEFVVELPETPFEGYVAGGIQLTPVVKREEGFFEKKELIVNKYAFLIGVLISESDTSQIKPELQLNGIYPKYQLGNRALVVNFSNSQGVYMEGMKVTVQVRKKNKTQTLFEIEKQDMRMAPHSMIEFNVPLGDKKLAAGEYTVQTEVKAATGKWSWTEDIKVTEKEVAELNGNKKESNQTGSSYGGWITITILIVGGVCLVTKKRCTQTKKKQRKLAINRRRE